MTVETDRKRWLALYVLCVGMLMMAPVLLEFFASSRTAYR